MSDSLGNPIFWTLVIYTIAGILTLTFLTGKWIGRVNSFIHTVAKFMEDIRSDMKGLRSDFKDMQIDLSAVRVNLTELRRDVSQIRGDVNDLREENKALRTDLSEVRGDVNEVRSDLNEVRADLNEVRSDVNRIKDKLAGMGEDVNALFTRVQASPISGGSPLQLTEIGEEISQLLAADKWAKSTVPALVASVSGMRSFEIQEFCTDFLHSNYSATSDQGLKVRACAYEFALTRNEVLNVLMVELRDELFRLLGDDHFDSKFDLTLAVT